MSTENKVLTTTPVLMSTTACCLQSLNGSQFVYAFGATQPDGTAKHRDHYLYYDGAIGTISAWVETGTLNITLSKA